MAFDDVPNMQLQINKLVWNGKDLGTWRSEIETQINHLKAKNTVGEMNGAVLRGELDWYFKDGEHQTDFNADFELANLFDVLTTWQYAPVLTSQSGEINIESDIFKITFNYVKNISFLASNNSIFKDLKLAKHSNYILLG